MPSNVLVDFEDIAARAARIESTASEIESLLGLLTRDMAAFADTYQGPGADAFQEVYNKWKLTQGQVHQELAEIGAALRATGQVRQQVETEIANKWAAAL